MPQWERNISVHRNGISRLTKSFRSGTELSNEFFARHPSTKILMLSEIGSFIPISSETASKPTSREPSRRRTTPKSSRCRLERAHMVDGSFLMTILSFCAARKLFLGDLLRKEVVSKCKQVDGRKLQFYISVSSSREQNFHPDGLMYE